jgi:hypothetical protein
MLPTSSTFPFFFMFLYTEIFLEQWCVSENEEQTCDWCYNAIITLNVWVKRLEILLCVWEILASNLYGVQLSWLMSFIVSPPSKWQNSTNRPQLFNSPSFPIHRSLPSYHLILHNLSNWESDIKYPSKEWINQIIGLYKTKSGVNE